MKRNSTPAAIDATALVEAAWQDVGASFERFCLTTGIATLSSMLEADAAQLCGPRHGRAPERRGHRWGRTKGKIGFHGGTVPIDRPRVRSRAGGEVALPSWEAARAEDWLGKWAMNLMLINVSTRRFGRAVRLPEGDVPTVVADGRSKSAVSRRFVELSAERMAEWMAADLSELDLLAIQIDGLHLEDELILVAAVGIDADGTKHPLSVIEGATENAATVQALLDNLIGRGLDPAVCRLFIVDGAKALTKAIRKTFGRHAPIQRCQVHKARNILERLPKHLHGSVRKVLRQAWELDDAETAPFDKLRVRAPDREPRPKAGARRARRRREHPRRARRDPDREPPRPAHATAPLARLHQHRREHERHHPTRLPQRQTLARCQDGAALDRGRHDRGRQGLQATESLKTAPRTPSRLGGASRQTRRP